MKAMKAIGISLTFLLLAGSLAGCWGTDPCGDDFFLQEYEDGGRACVHNDYRHLT